MNENDPNPQESGNVEAGLEVLLKKADELFRQKRYDDATEVLKGAAEEYPDSPLPHHDLSVLNLERLRETYSHLEIWEDLADDEAHFETAVAEAEVALDLDENFLPARNNLGTLFALRGWWEDAAEQWEISLTLQPDQSQVREELLEARKHVE
jgi:tetratricopeptide (TPR) repeat protein